MDGLATGSEFQRVLAALMGVQDITFLLFVDNCAAQTSSTPFVTNVKVVHYPPNATSLLQPLDLGIIKVFQALV